MAQNFVHGRDYQNTEFIDIGSAFRDDFDALLTSFSGSNEPQNPEEGQLWYDTSATDKILKQYDSTKQQWIEVDWNTVLGKDMRLARGSKGTLWERLEVALNPDGTLKAEQAENLTEWIDSSLTATYITGNEFEVSGDQTDIFNEGRAIKATLDASTVYSFVSSSSYDGTGGITTVILTSSVIDSTLQKVEYGLIKSGNEGSLPQFNVDYLLNLNAGNVPYDNTNTIYQSSDVQGVLDELSNLKQTYGIKVTDTGSDFVVERVGNNDTLDFNNISPWQDMRRCNLADDLTVNAYYGDPTFAYDGSNGQVMVEIPQFYWKAYRVAENQIVYLVSPINQDTFDIYPAFVDDYNTYDNIYIGAFEATLYDNSAGTYVGDGVTYDYTNDVMASVAGYQPISGNSANLDITQARQLAENRGSGWSLQYYTAREAINLLFYVEYADFNSQSMLSGGITNLDSGTGNHSQDTGHTTGLGNSSGEVSITLENGATGASTTYPFSYRGIENYWGNIWEFVDGINSRDNEPYISNNDFQSDLFSAPYESLGRTLPSSNGYGSGQVLDTNIGLSSLPISLNGSSSSYYCDYYYQNTGDRIARVAGTWFDDSQAGLAYWTLFNSAADSNRHIGSRCFARS